VIDDAFARAVEYEYAVKYLEHLGIEANQKNIRTMLNVVPFRDCTIAPAWEATGEVATAFYIYPDTKNIPKLPLKEGEDKKKEELVKISLPPIKERYKRTEEVHETKSKVPKLTIDNIKTRYLYPLSIDSESLCNRVVAGLKKLGNNIDLVKSTAMELPSHCLLPNEKEIKEELQRPITVCSFVR
jgi:hypothetical protein